MVENLTHLRLIDVPNQYQISEHISNITNARRGRISRLKIELFKNLEHLEIIHSVGDDFIDLGQECLYI